MGDRDEVRSSRPVPVAAVVLLVLASLLLLVNLGTVFLSHGPSCANSHGGGDSERIFTMTMMTLFAYACFGVPTILLVKARGNGIIAGVVGAVALIGQMLMVFVIGLSTLC